MEKKKLRMKLFKAFTQFASVTTDKGDLTYEGDLVEGTEVFDENIEPAADGDYVADGKTIVVKDGKVEKVIEETTEEKTDEVVVEAAEDVETETTEETTESDSTDEAETLKAKIAELEAEIAEKVAEIAELKGKPVDEPIQMEYGCHMEVKEKGALKYFQK